MTLLNSAVGEANASKPRTTPTAALRVGNTNRGQNSELSGDIDLRCSIEKQLTDPNISSDERQKLIEEQTQLNDPIDGLQKDKKDLQSLH